MGKTLGKWEIGAEGAGRDWKMLVIGSPDLSSGLSGGT